MSYTELSALKSHLSITGTTDDDALNALLAAVEAAIDQYTGRHFYGRLKTKYYREESIENQTLHLFEDLISVTTLTNGDATAIAAANYWLLPRNDGPPYWRIELKSSYYWLFVTDGWIEVYGYWGYSMTPPESVVTGSLLWASALWGRKESEGIISHKIGDFMETFGEWSTNPPDAARAFLDPLVRHWGYVD